MRHLTTPFALAVMVSLANAAKPAVVDDTAYLTFARHIAAHPLDPYGFTIHWYTVPEPAMGVLCPPVVPYWLALGMNLFGDAVPLLKLWMFPFVWLFAWAVREVLRRFARGSVGALPLVVLSPAVLPMVNVMLDIPAAALGLAALAVFCRVGTPHRGGVVGGEEVRQTATLTQQVGTAHRGGVVGGAHPTILAGLLAALALQTKYTALVVPPLLVWYGVTTGRVKAGVVAVVVAAVVFSAWEALVASKYGVSHFVFHLTDQSPGSGAGAFLDEKLALLPPLAGHLGCLAAWVGFYAGPAVGVPRRWVARAAAFWLVGAALVFLLPHRWSVVVPGKDEFHDKLTLAGLVWRTVGAGMLVTMATAAWVVVRKRPNPPTPFPQGKGEQEGQGPGTIVPGPSGAIVRSPSPLRGGVGEGFRSGRSPLSVFLVGWVLLELAAYFALTPFPAARRLVGVSVALAVLAARAVRVTRTPPARWVAPLAVGFAVCVTAVDTLDAYPEKVLAERAAAFTSGTTWYAGHWGFQWYCERAGMTALVPGWSRPEPGDFLVLPAYPDPHRFYRPHIGSTPLTPPADAVRVVAVCEWDDWLAAQTVPNFYGGVDPVVGRGAPRLRVVVYRVVKPWAVPRR